MKYLLVELSRLNTGYNFYFVLLILLLVDCKSLTNDVSQTSVSEFTFRVLFCKHYFTTVNLLLLSIYSHRFSSVAMAQENPIFLGSLPWDPGGFLVLMPTKVGVVPKTTTHENFHSYACPHSTLWNLSKLSYTYSYYFMYLEVSITSKPISIAVFFCMYLSL